MTGKNAKYSRFTQFSRGVTIGEVPVSPGHSGRVFWVGNNSTKFSGELGASNGNDGSFRKPFTTIDYAIGQCKANSGDTIYVRPNHTTTVSTADGVDLDVAGVSLIGLGNGTNRPRFDFTLAAGEVIVGASNCLIQNFNFHANVPSVLLGLTIEDGVDNTVVRGCLFDVETTITDAFVVPITLADNNIGTVIEGNEISMGLQALATHAIHMDNATGADDSTKILGNLIRGDYSTACIGSDTSACNDILIDDNLLINGETDALNTVACIVLLTGSSGVISDNQTVTNVANAAAAITADACIQFGNLYSETVNVDQAGNAILGADDSNNEFASTNVAANEDGSIIERLEQIQEAVNKGAGTALDAAKSLVDALGTNGTTLVDDAGSIAGMIGADDADNAMATSSVVANRDGSLYERTEYGFDNTSRGLSATVDLSSASPRTAFTVAGGPILIHFMALKITATCSSNAALVNFESTPTVGTAAQAITKVAAAPDLQDAVAGDWFAMAGGGAEVAVKYATSAQLLPDILTNISGGTIVDAGTILVVMSTDNLSTGTGILYMSYTPMAEGVTVS